MTIIPPVDIIDPDYSVLDLGDLDVTMLYIYEIKRDDYSDVHFHASFEMQYVTEGTLILETEGRTFQVRKGECVLIPPYVAHRNTGNNQHYGRFSMNVMLARDQNNDKKDFSEYVFYSDLFRRVDTVQYIADDDISGLFERFLALGGAPETRHRKELYLSMIFTSVSDMLRKRFPDSGAFGDSGSERLSLDDRKRGFMIEQYMALNYMNAGAARELQELLHLSRRQTDRIVRAATGSSIHQIAERYRMKMTGILTSQTDKPLGEIAEECGYTSYVGFYNAFLRFYGCSPEKYRKMKQSSSPD